MRILFLITTIGHGKGGHFHSLNTIANELGKCHDVKILNIGIKQSSVFEEGNYSIQFLKYNGFNFLSVLTRLKVFSLQFDPDAIHSFDVESFAFGRLISKKMNFPTILNKCGGPNPKKYYPKADKQVLFSLENYTYYQNNKRYRKSKLAFIPNRVKEVKIDKNRVNLFYEKYGRAEFSILRISRIGKHYHSSILQSINLLENMLEQGKNARLILIGTIQSEQIYKEIQKYIQIKNLKPYVIIETNDIFTNKASELLELGEIIVGTGRNFMEAASLNKILLVPQKDDRFPLLVIGDNFQEIFKTNFSPRTVVTNFDSGKNLKNILSLTNKNEKKNSQLWFKKYFDVETGVKLYLDLYNHDLPAKNNSLNIIDSTLNSIYSIKSLLRK
ncbi:hypothetical protein ACKGJN_16065 [Gillisia sp. Q332]|uniref:hypothetical protein n=1 Tax=Gillisia xinjiangensis TaxID=3384765 RepID=UPI00391C87B7